MALKIVLYGDPILRQKALAIAEVTEEVKQLAGEMIETMIRADSGGGLAAPQVGRSIRLFVLRDEKFSSSDEMEFHPPEVVINPVFSNPSKETEEADEGCLSLPKIQVKVERPLEIDVRYTNLQGEEIQERLKGFRARIFMHENDHLNGTLIIDRTSDKERRQVEPMLRKIKASIKLPSDRCKVAR